MKYGSPFAGKRRQTRSSTRDALRVMENGEIEGVVIAVRGRSGLQVFELQYENQKKENP